MYSLYIAFIAVVTTATALTFDCVFVEVKWMGIGMHYQCQTTPQNDDSTQYLTNVTGNHMQNKTNDDVAAIHIGSCKDLTYIPKGMLHIFPNLIAIYLHGCGITTLNGTELNEYPKLKLFALEMSPLEYVPGNFFAQNPDVFFVSFNDNKIKMTGRDLFGNLNKLSEIHFENNTCIDANATTIEEVTELKEKLNQKCSFDANATIIPEVNELEEAVNQNSSFANDLLNPDIDANATTLEKVIELEKMLNQTSSLAKDRLGSVSLQTLLLSVLICFGNYFWLN